MDIRKRVSQGPSYRWISYLVDFGSWSGHPRMDQQGVPEPILEAWRSQNAAGEPTLLRSQLVGQSISVNRETKMVSVVAFAGRSSQRRWERARRGSWTLNHLSGARSGQL